ncbi:MAG TPA: class I SAM-dependent methyltransferase [Candidatus Melainabacteria bacterium]|nr:class I SAM-dependent methyltransferase [Candidatus Melainabacteria bacterium]
MTDQHYLNPLLVELYDLDSGWSEDRQYYLSLASGKDMRILDLGCGTGLLCNAYARSGHKVVGVDPSSAMLQSARQKEFGAEIEWIESSAQEFRSPEKFDLIIMTGHAFQVLLTDEDIASTFDTIKAQLAPYGLAVFESRNPSIEWSSRWNYEIELSSPRGSVIEKREFLSFESGTEFMNFELKYSFLEAEFVSRSRLRFPGLEKIKSGLDEATLALEALFGDWQQGDFLANRSEEMIFHVRSF